MRTCIEIVLAFQTMFPDGNVGVNLSVDGTVVPAWAAQVGPGRGAGTEQREEFLRRRARDAGFRKMPKAGSREPRRVRGYLFTLISEVVTGLPLVGVLNDLSVGVEAHTIRQLLPLLFQLWPDCPVEHLAADAGWDHDEAHEYALRQYGIGLVARRAESHAKRGGVLLDGKKTVGRINGVGEAFCLEHGNLMRHRWYDIVDVHDRRARGLQPGVPVDASEFRVHLESDCCGRAAVPMSAAWSALPTLPHSPRSHMKLHARRTAIKPQTNTSEANNSSLKVAYAQGLDGPHRLRFTDSRQVEGMIWLALANRALLLLKSAR